MTNEPRDEGVPNPEGEELVEADLPGMSDPASRPPSPPRPPGERPTVPADNEASGDSLGETLSEALRPDPFDAPVEDSVIDELEFDLPRAAAGVPYDAPPDRPVEDDGLRPLQEDRIRPAIETSISDESRVRQAEADRALAAEHQPIPLTDDRVRPALQTTISSGSRTLQMLVVGALLAAGGIAGLLLLLDPFGGDDSDASALPAATAAASADATGGGDEAPLTATPAQPLAEVTGYEEFTLTGFQPVADADGDLWVLLELVSPWGQDPPEVEFVYSALIGAGVVLDGRINGSLYSLTEGLSYGESVFGSPDFPRSSNDFSASFQALQPDLWITDDGAIAVHLPGPSPTGGIDSALVSPDTTLITVNVIQSEPGVAEFNVRLEQAIGEVLAGDSYPLPDWIEIQPDSEPLQLNVPDTSNSD